MKVTGDEGVANLDHGGAVSRRPRAQFVASTLGVILLASSAFAQGTLSLNDYVQQVTQGHKGWQSSQKAAAGAALREDEGKVMTSPQVSAQVQHVSDQKPSATSFISGDKVISDSYTAGIGQQTRFGLKAQFNYTMSQTELFNANPQFVKESKYYEGRPSIEVSQSLWKNGFGSETKTTESLLAAQTRLSSQSEAYKQKMYGLEAEMVYWRLVLARETVGAQRAALERALKIKAWSARRSQLDLGDKADLFQAESAVKLRDLELQIAVDEERAAARAFNLARGLESADVKESLTRITPSMLDRMAEPAKVGERPDVKVAREALALSTASAALGQEKYKPNLDAFASYALNGHEATMGDAMSSSFKTDKPTLAVGLKISAPLTWGIASRAQDGYIQEKYGADLNYQRKLFENNAEWLDLEQKLADSKKRLQLTRAMESTQKEKLEYEKDRQSRGRTTTYQVLAFEQDFAAAELARIRSQADVLRIVAQMKTFGGNQ